MPELQDHHLALWDQEMPGFSVLQVLAKEFAGSLQTTIQVSRPTRVNGLIDLIVDGIEMYLCANSVANAPDTNTFIEHLGAIVASQPNSANRTLVLEHLADTRFVIQAFVDSPEPDTRNEWEFQLLLPFAESVGFFADSDSESLAFYEFSHDDFLNFKCPEYFSGT